MNSGWNFKSIIVSDAGNHNLKHDIYAWHWRRAGIRISINSKIDCYSGISNEHIKWIRCSHTRYTTLKRKQKCITYHHYQTRLLDSFLQVKKIPFHRHLFDFVSCYLQKCWWQHSFQFYEINFHVVFCFALMAMAMSYNCANVPVVCYASIK